MKGGKETKEVIPFVLSHKETIESPMVTTFRNFFGFCKKSLNKCLRTTGTEYNVFSCHCRVAYHDGLQKPIHLYLGSEIHVLLEFFLQMGKDRAEIMHVSNQLYLV